MIKEINKLLSYKYLIYKGERGVLNITFDSIDYDDCLLVIYINKSHSTITLMRDNILGINFEKRFNDYDVIKINYTLPDSAIAHELKLYGVEADGFMGDHNYESTISEMLFNNQESGYIS